MPRGSFTNKQQALDAIVDVDRAYKDPVGVTVKNGTHAWVVLGYRTSHDPIEPTKKTILGFYVSGPLGSAADKWPYRYLTVSQFKSYFTRYHEWQRKVIWEGKWVVDRPVRPGPRPARGATMAATCTPSSWPAAVGPDSIP